jgi:hypothetical protein
MFLHVFVERIAQRSILIGCGRTGERTSDRRSRRRDRLMSIDSARAAESAEGRKR